MLTGVVIAGSEARMNVMGLRCSPEGLCYVILAGTQAAPIIVHGENLSMPAGVERGEALSWVRAELKELTAKYEVKRACLKAIEPNALKKDLRRAQTEGVALAALYECLSRSVPLRTKQQLRSSLPGFEVPARYYDRELRTRGITRFRDKALTEAALAALVELPRGE